MRAVVTVIGKDLNLNMFFKEFELPTAPTFPNLEVRITDFGAKENCICTDSIAKAIAFVNQNTILPVWHLLKRGDLY